MADASEALRQILERVRADPEQALKLLDRLQETDHWRGNANDVVT